MDILLVVFFVALIIVGVFILGYSVGYSDGWKSARPFEKKTARPFEKK